MTKSFNIAAAVLFALTAVASAEDDRPINMKWKTLAPAEGDQFRDPFARLTRQQLQSLGFVARIERLIAAEKVSPDGKSAAEAATIARQLNKQGIDVPGLLAQRGRVALLREKREASLTKSIANKFDGKHVTLTGYVVPLKATAGRVTEFFLVSSPALCSHEASPPANRLVYVKSADGLADWSRMKPARVTGRLQAIQTSRVVRRGGGPKEFTAAYAIVRANTVPVREGTDDVTD